MEEFDVVDINRNMMGYTKTRGEELLDNEYNTGVELWNFYNHKLLMTQRASNKSHPFEWEVPGGCSQKGETSIDTLLREINEEIGYKLDHNYELIGTSLYKHNYVDSYKSNINIDINNCILQDSEINDIKYFTKDEFIKLNNDNKIVKSNYNRYLEYQDLLDKDW